MVEPKTHLFNHFEDCRSALNTWRSQHRESSCQAVGLSFVSCGPSPESEYKSSLTWLRRHNPVTPHQNDSRVVLPILSSAFYSFSAQASTFLRGTASVASTVLKRIFTPVDEQGGITLSYVCLHCFPFEDNIWWVSSRKEAVVVAASTIGKLRTQFRPLKAVRTAEMPTFFRAYAAP